MDKRTEVEEMINRLNTSEDGCKGIMLIDTKKNINLMTCEMVKKLGEGKFGKAFLLKCDGAEYVIKQICADYILIGDTKFYNKYSDEFYKDQEAFATKYPSFVTPNSKNLEKNFFWLNPFSYNFKFKKMKSIISKNIYEETGTYFNLEFRPQISYKIFKNKNKYSLFDILLETFSVRNVQYKYNSFIFEFLDFPDTFEENYYKDYIFTSLNFLKEKSFLSLLKDYPFKPELSDFFKGSFLTEKSKNMLNASRHFRFKKNNFF